MSSSKRSDSAPPPRTRHAEPRDEPRNDPSPQENNPEPPVDETDDGPETAPGDRGED